MALGIPGPQGLAIAVGTAAAALLAGAAACGGDPAPSPGGPTAGQTPRESPTPAATEVGPTATPDATATTDPGDDSEAVAPTRRARQGPARSGRTYDVQAGDTCIHIARDHHVTLGELREANPSLDEECAIFPGDELTLPPPSFHPSDTRSGVGAVDEVLDAVLSGDPETVKTVFDYVSVECGPEGVQGSHGGMRCPEGIEDGSHVDALPVVTCEGEWRPRRGIDRFLEPMGAGHWLAGGSVRPYAIHEVDGDAGGYWEAGDYRVVFRASASDWGHAVTVTEEGGITSVFTGCGHTAEALIADVSAEAFLVPPP